MSYSPPRNQWGPPWEFRQGPAKPRTTGVRLMTGVEWGDPKIKTRIMRVPEREEVGPNRALVVAVAAIGLAVVLAALWLRLADKALDAPPRVWTTPEAEVGK